MWLEQRARGELYERSSRRASHSSYFSSQIKSLGFQPKRLARGGGEGICLFNLSGCYPRDGVEGWTRMGTRWPVEVGQVKNMDLGSDSGGRLRSQWIPKN